MVLSGQIKIDGIDVSNVAFSANTVSELVAQLQARVDAKAAIAAAVTAANLALQS